MADRLQNPQKAGHLFDGWQEAIVWSCLQNVMGAVYADDSENPQSAMAVLGDFCFFAGRPEKELARYRSVWRGREFMIMIPQNEGWSDVIRGCYGEKARKVTRYAIKKERDVFDRNKLLAAVHSLKPGFEIKMIEKDCFELCRSNKWSQDLVSQFENYEMYERLGIGAVVLKDGALVSGASAYARYQDGIEIEIDTVESCRRMGLAYACGARLILECLERSLYPSWDAHNRGSVALAEKLGYHFDYKYPAFEIFK